MSEHAPINLPRPAFSLALSLSFYLLLIGVALIQVFGIFRGLSSPAGMDQAQLARELARGNGFHTKVVRPYAWRQMIEAGKDAPLSQLQDTAQPPVQPLIWAPVFKALEKWSAYDPGAGSAVYLLDRVIGCLGAIWFLLVILLNYLTIRRLFDDSVALVTAIILALCQPLWEIAMSGSPQMLAMLWFSFGFWCLVSALHKAEAQQSPWLPLLGASFACGLLVLTHWMALWLVLGLVTAAALLLPRKIASALVVALIPALCAAGWCWRNHSLCGDSLGAAKATFQSLLVYGGDEPLLREFVSMNPAVAVDSLLRKIGLNFQMQWQNAFMHLAAITPAFFFFLALLHPFRRADTGAARWALGVVWVVVALGMSLIGLKLDQPDDNDLFCALVPAMTGFGVAMLAVFWARLGFQSGWFWRQSGYAVVAIVISALPMITKLPTALRIGINFRGQLAHWPPYMPDRFARLNKFITDKEVLFADAPWALAWYADRTSVWMPISRKQFVPMREKIESHGEKVAGFVITPVSAKVERLTEIFDGGYREWADVIYRGPMIAFQQEVRSTAEFPYNSVYPLVGVPLPETGGLNVSMVYYADRVRWDAPKQDTANK